jgi:hypothetical protein
MPLVSVWTEREEMAVLVPTEVRVKRSPLGLLYLTDWQAVTKSEQVNRRKQR